MQKIGINTAFSCAVLMMASSFAMATSMTCNRRSVPACQVGFPVEFSGGTIPADIGFVRFSSPAVAHLGIINDGKADIVVGTTGGYVIAYHADGTFLWAHKTGTIAVDSKPAIADIDGDGKQEVIVGAGEVNKAGGGVYVLHNDGTAKCAFTALDTAPLAGGVYSSPALAHIDRTQPNQMQIVFGSWDGHVRALRADCSLWWAKGVPDDVIDTVWSSAALYDLDHDGQIDVIIGQDSGQGQLSNGRHVGGQVRAFRGTGVGELSGFPIKLDEVVWSSPAIGDITGTNQAAVVVGNGRCYDLAACAPSGLVQPVTDGVYGWNSAGVALAGWIYPTTAQAAHSASPALADLDRDGKLETVITEIDKSDDKSAHLHMIHSSGTLDPGWSVQPMIALSCSQNVHWLTAFGSPILVDLNGDGNAEVIVGGGTELAVFDRSGSQLSQMAPGACIEPPNPNVYALLTASSVNSSPTAADLDGDGKIELIVGSASTLGGPTGALFAWKFPNSLAIPTNMPWPQFRHDAQNTGVYVTDLIFKNGFD